MVYQDEIPGWRKRGLERGAKYIMVYLDTFDYMYYPVFVDSEEALAERRASASDAFIATIEL